MKAKTHLCTNNNQTVNELVVFFVIFVAVKMKLTAFYHPLLVFLLIINLTGEQKSSCLSKMIESGI